jgi:hypothetical protein
MQMSYFDFFFPPDFAFLAARARARTFFITRLSAADSLITSDNMIHL